MNRRGFLKLFGGAAAVATVAPTYFFSPIGGWKSDVIVNPTTYIVGQNAYVGQYADYLKFSDLALETPIDPMLGQLFGYRMTVTLEALTSTRIARVA
jgi:hypothetical protein